MSSFLVPVLEPCDTGSPSMSTKAEDNLSNSEGPLIKKNIRNYTSSTDISAVIKRSPASRSVVSQQQQQQQQDPSSFTDTEKKRYCLWTLTFILAMVGFSNLLLSITIISVLRVSQGSMESLEIITNENLVKFFGKTDLDRVCVEDGVCQGYGDEPVELSGDDSGVHLNVIKNRRGHDHLAAAAAAAAGGNLWVLKNGTTVSQIESFEVKDFRTGDSFFSTDFPNFGLPSGVGKLNVKVAQTHRIVSPINESLVVDSNREITINGAESLKIDDTKQIVWMADNQIKLKSNDSIVLEAANGVYIDTKKIPIVSAGLSSSQSSGGGSGSEELSSSQYKICVCMPEGKLFRIQIPPPAAAAAATGNVRVNCARVSSMSAVDNPCLS